MPVIAPLVGMHFRPPAKLVLAALPAGAKLVLVPEPENPYDHKAIKVLVAPGEIPVSQHETLALALPATGFDLFEVLAMEQVFLGYVADSEGKLCQTRGFNGNAEIAAAVGVEGWPAPAVLAFDPSGQPCVVYG